MGRFNPGNSTLNARPPLILANLINFSGHITQTPVYNTEEYFYPMDHPTKAQPLVVIIGRE